MSLTRIYRFTHNKAEELEVGTSVPPSGVNLMSLCGFSAVLFMNEFERMGAQNIDIAQTCNLSEWHRRLFAGKNHTQYTMDSQGEPVDIASLPAKHSARSGLIYATTSIRENDSEETFTAFLFAVHKRSLAKPIPQQLSQSPTVSSETQKRVDDLGVTHIWLCGSAPDQRRQKLMSSLLAQLEKDVIEWKAEGQASGVISVHTIPQHFPGMVRFLESRGFRGGQRYEGGGDKVVYWKEV